MKSNYRRYDSTESFGRIREILNQSDLKYEEEDNLPNRDRLTYENGFYANCASLFIDIRGSSKLPQKLKRPTLARLYRAYVSEVVALLNSDVGCREVNIVGDGAWAVYNTPLKTDLDDVFSIAARLNSMVEVLNYELGRRDIDPIRVGIGMAWGRALMIKAGFKGSGLDEVVYMGDVVNRAAKLAAFGNDTYNDHPVMVDDVFQSNLNEHNKGLVTWNSRRSCWHANVVNLEMDAWLKESRK
ncbi:adenylate/guanylate cyclase domain-containing protein [Arthrobacter sp.]|uniref:adenylate/guanylate cyclase domain-containing protein n=1 Tax=Arthrobacter sp. TaxID=1667 RepID=UPI003A909ABF